LNNYIAERSDKSHTYGPARNASSNKINSFFVFLSPLPGVTINNVRSRTPHCDTDDKIYDSIITMKIPSEEKKKKGSFHPIAMIKWPCLKEVLHSFFAG